MKRTGERFISPPSSNVYLTKSCVVLGRYKHAASGIVCYQSCTVQLSVILYAHQTIEDDIVSYNLSFVVYIDKVTMYCKVGIFDIGTKECRKVDTSFYRIKILQKYSQFPPNSN